MALMWQHSLQGMQPMGSQGMGHPSGLLAGMPQGLQGLSYRNVDEKCGELVLMWRWHLQGMQPMGSQGMGDPGSLLAGMPQGLQGLPPHLTAQLMQAQAAQSNPMHNPLHMLQLMQSMGTLPPHMLPLLLQVKLTKLIN